MYVSVNFYDKTWRIKNKLNTFDIDDNFTDDDEFTKKMKVASKEKK